VATTSASHRYRPLARAVQRQLGFHRSLAGHAGHGDVVERDRLVGPVGEHRRGVLLDGEVAGVQPVQRGVELIGLHLDQEAEVAEVHAEDRDRPVRDESQRAEHRAVAAEADQRVGLVGQLGLAHRLDLTGQARGVPGVGDQLLAVRPRPACELLGDRRRVIARVEDEPESPNPLDRRHEPLTPSAATRARPRARRAPCSRRR
jgi:hypothetical protein